MKVHEKLPRRIYLRISSFSVFPFCVARLFGPLSPENSAYNGSDMRQGGYR